MAPYLGRPSRSWAKLVRPSLTEYGPDIPRLNWASGCSFVSSSRRRTHARCHGWVTNCQTPQPFLSSCTPRERGSSWSFDHLPRRPFFPSLQKEKKRQRKSSPGRPHSASTPGLATCRAELQGCSTLRARSGSGSGSLTDRASCARHHEPHS